MANFYDSRLEGSRLDGVFQRIIVRKDRPEGIKGVLVGFAVAGVEQVWSFSRFLLLQFDPDYHRCNDLVRMRMIAIIAIYSLYR